ncbi:MAG: hypothetical protein D4R65_04735 [Verrucomicrobiaceae bacterium]|nr:MAG: hypothetical protein D4R65_04735 [Verrucomicrobiaceae bacterium]
MKPPIPASLIALPLVVALALSGLTGCEKKSRTTTETSTTSTSPATPTTAAGKPPMNWTTSFPGNKSGEWFPRPLPLTKLPLTQTIDVADFGAKPDDNQDDTQAIQSAFDAAKICRVPCKVQFSKGTYRISISKSPGEQGRSFLLDGLKDTVIDGAGALLLQTDPTQGIFNFKRCESVIVRDLLIDYDPLPFTQGTIQRIQADPPQIDFAIAEGYPTLDDPQFFNGKKINMCVPLDPNIPGRLRDGARNFFLYKTAEKLADGVYRLPFIDLHPGWEHDLSVGGRFSVFARNDIPVANFDYCRQVTMQGITTFASGGGQYTGTYNDCINILGCKALIKPGRWKGGNADVIHIYGSRGGGPWVEDCVFEGIGDDVICIYNGRPVFIRQVISPTELILGSVHLNDTAKGDFAPLKNEQIQPGERLAFLNPQTGRLVGESEVERISSATGQVVLKQPIETGGLTAGSEKGNTQVYNTGIGGNFVVRNNRISNSRRYGMFLKAADGLVEGNRIDGVSASGIYISDEPAWPEGLQAARLVIRNNEIVNCGFDELFHIDPCQAQISIYSQNVKRKPVSDDPNFHHDITLEGNKIENWSKLGFYLSNVTRLTVKDTHLGEPREKPAAFLFKGPLGVTAIEPFPPGFPETPDPRTQN